MKNFYLMGIVDGKKFSISCDELEIGIYQKSDKTISMPIVLSGKNFEAGTALTVVPKQRANKNGVLLSSKNQILFISKK